MLHLMPSSNLSHFFLFRLIIFHFMYSETQLFQFSFHLYASLSFYFSWIPFISFKVQNISNGIFYHVISPKPKNELKNVQNLTLPLNQGIQDFLDFKVARCCEGYSFWGYLRILSLKFQKARTKIDFKLKVLKYSRNCSLHNTLIPNLVKPLPYILLFRTSDLINKIHFEIVGPFYIC